MAAVIPEGKALEAGARPGAADLVDAARGASAELERESAALHPSEVGAFRGELMRQVAGFLSRVESGSIDRSSAGAQRLGAEFFTFGSYPGAEEYMEAARQAPGCPQP